jgi:hypothetical protein
LVLLDAARLCVRGAWSCTADQTRLGWVA